MTRIWLIGLLSVLDALAASPPRIASFSPAATRILTDLGATGEVTAATRWCELPEGHPARRDCDAFEPDLEALRASGAEIAILPRLANPMLAARVRSLGLRTIVLAPESPDSPAEDIASLAEALGRQPAGRSLLDARKAVRHPATGKRVLIIWDGVCAGPSSYLSWVIRSAGAEVAIPEGTWPAWDIELATRSAPDLVLRLGANGPATPEVDREALKAWRATPGLRTTHAAQAGCVYHLKPGTDWLPASGQPRAAATLADLLRK